MQWGVWQDPKYDSNLSVIFFCLGFFVYPALKSRLKDSNYYGISNYMDKDGLTDTGQLCESKTRQGLKVTGIYYFHWGKYVRIRSFSGPYFPAFELNTYSIQLRENPDQRNFEYGQFSRSLFTDNIQNLYSRFVFKNRYYKKTLHNNNTRCFICVLYLHAKHLDSFSLKLQAADFQFY